MLCKINFILIFAFLSKLPLIASGGIDTLALNNFIKEESSFIDDSTHWDTITQFLDKQLSNSELNSKSHFHLRSKATVLLSQVLYRKGNYERTTDLIDPLLPHIDSLSPKLNRDISKKILLIKGALKLIENDYYNIDKYYKKWIEIASKIDSNYYFELSFVNERIANAISFQYANPERLDTAYHYYSKALQILQDTSKVNPENHEDYCEYELGILSNIGVAKRVLGDAVGAIAALRKVIPKIDACYPEVSDDPLKALDRYWYTFYGLAFSYSRIGEYETSDYYYERIFKELLPRKEEWCNYSIVGLLNGKGLNCFWSANYEEGIQYFKKALSVEDCNFSAARSMSYNCIGHCYFELDEYELADDFLDKSIAAAIAEDTVHYNLGIAQRTKSYVAIKKGDPKAGIDLCRAALSNFHFAKIHREDHNMYTAMSQAFLDLNQIDSSQYYCELSMDLLGFDTLSSYILKPRNFGDEILYNFDVYSNIMEDRYQSSNDIDYLIKRNKILSDAFEIIDYRMTNLRGVNSVLTFIKKHAQMTYDCIQSDIELFDQTNDPNYLYAALNKADRNKSRLGIQNLKLQDKSIFDEKQQDIFDELRLMNEDHRLTNTQINKTDKEVKKDQLKLKLFDLDIKITALEAQLRESNVIYNSQNSQNNYATLTGQLDNDEMVLLFFKDQQDYQCFAIQKDNINHLNIAWNDTKEKNVDDLLASINNSKLSHNFQKTIEAVSADLLSQINIPSGVTKLVIIPDNKIGLIPFEILSFGSSNLINQYDISYAASYRLLFQQRATKSNAKKTVACFAPKYTKNIDLAETTKKDDLLALLIRSGEYELPGAKNEAESISNLLNGDLYLDDQANEENFRSQINQYKILHLAMHAISDNTSPMNSKMVLTQNTEEVQTHEDNNIHAHELYKMRINSDLAVLSACNTGFGKVEEGEGVLSLSKAFGAAGVPSVVHSLWNVPDEATSKIMTQFYSNLKEGQRKDEALKNAKLNYINDASIPSSLKSPYYWAGFIASGNMDALSFNSNTPIYVLACLLFFLALFAIWKLSSAKKLN